MTEGRIYGKAPQIDLDIELSRQKHCLTQLKGLVQSAHDVSEGGLGVAIAESVMTTENLGANVTVEGKRHYYSLNLNPASSFRSKRTPSGV